MYITGGSVKWLDFENRVIEIIVPKLGPLN